MPGDTDTEPHAIAEMHPSFCALRRTYQRIGARKGANGPMPWALGHHALDVGQSHSPHNMGITAHKGSSPGPGQPWPWPWPPSPGP